MPPACSCTAGRSRRPNPAPPPTSTRPSSTWASTVCSATTAISQCARATSSSRRATDETMNAHGSLTDVRGLSVGHHTETRRPTGCTVILAPEGAVAGVDVRGAAPGTRETELLSPLNAIEKVHAIMLAGGSAFGLDAAGGVMRWLEERGIGVQVGPARVPIVPAAILFDLWVGAAS